MLFDSHSLLTKMLMSFTLLQVTLQMNVFVASTFYTELSGRLYKNVCTVVYWFNFAFLIPAEYCHSCKSNLSSDPGINLFHILIFVGLFFYYYFCHRILLLRNNTLRIVNSSRADEGSYVCRADNQFGSAEMTAVLWVKGKWCPGGTLFSARLAKVRHQETEPNVIPPPPPPLRLHGC